MEKETLKLRPAVCVKVIYLFGSSATMGVNFIAEQDAWMSILLAAIFTFPIFMIYARIMRLLPGKNLFEIFEVLFGKIGGKVLTVLMGWYALHLCGMILLDFTDFIRICIMPETPQLPIMIGIFLVIAYMAKSGVGTMGKWSTFMIIVTILIIASTVLLSINKMDFSRMMPIFSHSPATIAASAVQLVVFPYLEVVTILCATGGMEREDNPYKMYTYALLAGTAVLVTICLRNLFVLGPTVVDREYFPSFIAVKIINVGEIVSRLEGLIAMNFIIAAVLKLTVCLMGAAKGMSHLFGIADYKKLVMPVGLLAVMISTAVFQSIMEMRNFLPIYEYYSIPFQIVIPVIAWITAEVKLRRTKNSLLSAGTENT